MSKNEEEYIGKIIDDYKTNWYHLLVLDHLSNLLFQIYEDTKSHWITWKYSLIEDNKKVNFLVINRHGN
jgi:hypothetical protein